MKKLIPILILLSAMLQACNSTPENDIPDMQFRIAVDPKLLKPCKPLPIIPTPVNSPDPVAEHQLVVIGLYGECSKQQDSSIEAIQSISAGK